MRKKENKKVLSKKEVIELIESYCTAYTDDLWDTFLQFINTVIIPKFPNRREPLQYIT